MNLYIVSLFEMKAELGLKDAQDDGLLGRWMEGLQGRFEEYCNRKFERVQNESEILDGGGDYLLLRRFPVEAVVTVHIDAEQSWTDGTLISASDYILNQERGRISYGISPWPAGKQNIRVVYNGGYVPSGRPVGTGENAMPEALRSAFIIQGEFEWRNRANFGKQSIGAQGMNVNLAPAKFLPIVEQTLSIFTRV